MRMPTREELHKLIDSMPEGAIEAAHRALTNMQVWPPAPPPTVEEMRQQMRKRMDERRLEMMQRQKPGTIAGFGGTSNYDPTKGAGASSFNYWDGDTYIQETYRRHLGHEFTVIERIRIDGQRLIYKHQITGPGEKRDEREIIFDL
jgi:hypothetical protein